MRRRPSTGNNSRCREKRLDPSIRSFWIGRPAFRIRTPGPPDALPETIRTRLIWAGQMVRGPLPRCRAPPPASPSPRRPIWTDDEQAWTDNRPAGSRQIASGQAIPDQPSPRQREVDSAARMMEHPHRALESRNASSVHDSAPAPFPASSPPKNADAREFSGRLARSLGLPENFFADRDAAELGEEVGALLQITIYSLMELLQARNQAKQMARSANQTTVQLSRKQSAEAFADAGGSDPASVRTTDAKLPGRARRLYPRLRRSEVASIQDIHRDAAGCRQAGCQRRPEQPWRVTSKAADRRGSVRARANCGTRF